MRPFTLEEVTIDRDWKPDLKQEYLVQYKFQKDKESVFVIGRFHKVWFGYNFRWFWGAASLQLSTESHSNDIENFLGIWEVHKPPEDPALEIVNFVTKEEMDI